VRDLSRPLQEGLEALGGQGNLQEVLRRYPEERDELIGLLRLSVDLGTLGPPAADPAFRLRARNRMLAAAAERRRAQRWNPFGRLPRPVLRLAATAALGAAVVAGGVTAAAASAASLPGDPLYGVKLGVEQAQLALSFNAESRARLQLQFADVRLDEAQKLFAAGRKQDGVQLVDQYEAAVAQFNRSITTSALDDRAVNDWSRYLDDRQALADERLHTLAGTLTAGGDAQAAAIVARTQTHVDESFRGGKRDLQAHRGGQPDRSPKPAGGGE
jgi:Domain of unknown function (DUF5667)